MKTATTNARIFVVMIFLFSFTAILLNAQEVIYTNNWGNQGFTVIDQTINSIEINHSVSSFHFSKTQINGKTLDAIKITGSFLPNEEGKPDLPLMNRLIAIPNGASISLRITGSRIESFSEIELAPAPRIPWQTETGPLEYSRNMNVYAKNAFYPEQPVIVSEITRIRGIDAVMLAISPFQYNPITKELIVYRDLKVKIDFEGGNGHFGENRLRNRWWDPLLEDMLLNYNSLPEINYSLKTKNITNDDGAAYLIISPNDAEFQQWADSIRNFRTTQGILSKVVTLDEIGGNDVSLIENYINEAYNTWEIPPIAILLLGDHGSNAANSVIAPIWDNYCVSDNIYADVNGDEMPDIIVARMCAQNATELETMVTKFLEYEENPPTDPNFYNHPITSCQFQSGGLAQICTESLAGFYEVIQNKSTNRINVCNGTLPDEWSTAPNSAAWVNYFGPNGLGYIPATPAQVNSTWNGNTNDIITGINDGAFMLLHRGTGSTQGWGAPAFSNNDINALNNNNLTFIWSIDCLTGKFNFAGECFAEKFHRHTSGGNNAGALGIVAASEISYSFVNDVYAWGAFDNMWNDFMPDVNTTPESKGVLPAFANVAGKYFLYQSSWPYNPGNKIVTYNIFHYFGDAFSTIYTEMPQELEVSHASWLLAGETSFEITANEGSLMALSVDGELIGVAEGTGEPVAIQIPAQTFPGQMLVTITKQNHYRYESWIPVGTGTGMQEIQSLNDFNIFPNPSNGKFSLKYKENPGTINFTVLNTLSEVVLSANNKGFKNEVITIILYDQPPGLYYIILESDSMKTIRKVVIQ